VKRSPKSSNARPSGEIPRSGRSHQVRTQNHTDGDFSYKGKPQYHTRDRKQELATDYTRQANFWAPQQAADGPIPEKLLRSVKRDTPNHSWKENRAQNPRQSTSSTTITFGVVVKTKRAATPTRSPTKRRVGERRLASEAWFCGGGAGRGRTRLGEAKRVGEGEVAVER
jgi:hypothetical protein